MSSFCLIVEPIPLVAQDLAITARENLGCEPLLASTLPEALDLLKSLDATAPLPLAFVHENASRFEKSALRPKLEGRGTEIILLGPDPGSAWPSKGWPALVWPFSTDQVLELINSLDSRRLRPTAG